MSPLTERWCAGLISWLAVAASFAQTVPIHPNTARGFTADGSYSTRDLDTVNLQNGNLTLAIPVGQRYPITANFSYGLTLYYNSNVWKATYRAVCRPEGIPCVAADPDSGFSAGLGWTLSLGNLFASGEGGNDTGRWLYVAPDGSRHVFHDSLHDGEPIAPNIRYARDGSYLRLRTAIREVEFPDGTVHSFTGNELSGMRDRFGAAHDVTVSSTTSGSNRTTTISDRHGRVHRLYFTNDGTSTKPAYRVTRVELAAFGTSTPTTYDFVFEAPTSIYRPAEDTFAGNSATVPVRFLRSIAISSASTATLTYNMTATGGALGYYTGDSSQTSPTGMIKTIELPTQGRISWEFGTWAFPVPSEFVWLRRVDGVTKRSTTVPNGTGGNWFYRPTPWPTANPNELITEVEDPQGNFSIHYFNMPKTWNASTWSGWEYGLPFTQRETYNGRFLSSELATCGFNQTSGTSPCRQRSTWVTYAHDKLPTISSIDQIGAWYASNRRLNGMATKFDDDGANRYTASALSHFDGLGHYRLTSRSGFLDNTVSRTERLQFNGDGCYELSAPNTIGGCPGSGQVYVAPATNTPWLLNDFSYAEQTEAGSTARQEADFDTTNGRLKCLRLLKSGTTEGSEDVAVEFGADADGNLTFEKYRGGDNAGLAVGGACAPTGNPNYWLSHAYSSGALASSQYLKPGGTPVGFKHYDATIDANTGLASELRDPSGYLIRAAFDGLGRPLSVSPMGTAAASPPASREAKTEYSYTNASGNSAAKVKIRRIYCSNGTTTCPGPEFGEVELHFDGLGQQIREWVKQLDGSWAKKEVAFNASGWLTSVSEFGANAQGQNTLLQQHDLFGRPHHIETPDSKDIELDYHGVREFLRTVRIHTTSGQPEAPATTTEVYDAFGRLIRVKEPANPNGSNSTTSYAYDVGHRLTSVDQQTSAGSQSRAFTYDGRGFLLQQRHPEKGTLGNGNVTFQNIDARGHAGRILDGAGAWDRSFTYDAAERLLTIAEGSAPSRILKEFTYDGLGGNVLGRLHTATRHNYVGAPFNTDYKVTETYAYDGVGRRPSQRTTQTHIFGSAQERFEQGWTYDRGGNVVALDYPKCFGGTCPPSGTAPRTQGYAYTGSFLTGVTGFASSFSYHPSGMLNALAMSNGLSQLVFRDPDDLPRPLEIRYVQTANNASVVATTGVYGFDSSGNVKSLNGREFLYDLVGRIKSGTVSVGATPRTQTASYDGFGNLLSITNNGITRATPTTASTNRVTGASYDAAGNLTAWNGSSYTYDRMNMLSQVCTSGTIASCTGENWIFAYTADDERILEYRVGGGAFRTSIRDLSGRTLREYRLEAASNWASFEDYIYRGDALLASISPTEGTRYFGTDHLGTPRFAFGTTGTLLATHTYYPYGEEATPPNADTQQMKFTGHERDLLNTASTADDTDYMHARQFSLQLGRFMSTDRVNGNPQRPQSFNLYAYVTGNPMKYVDPYGLDKIDVIGKDPCSPPIESSSCLVELPPEPPPRERPERDRDEETRDCASTSAMGPFQGLAEALEGLRGIAAGGSLAIYGIPGVLGLGLDANVVARPDGSADLYVGVGLVAGGSTNAYRTSESVQLVGRGDRILGWAFRGSGAAQFAPTPIGVRASFLGDLSGPTGSAGVGIVIGYSGSLTGGYVFQLVKPCKATD